MDKSITTIIASNNAKTVQSEQRSLSPTQSHAIGSVYRIEDDFLVCSIHTPTEDVQIRLAKNLFPEDTYSGMPFTLTVIEHNGFEKPQITKRALRQNEESDVRKGLRTYLESLDE